MTNLVSKVKQATNIIFSDVIDTPYPYCVIPKKHFQMLSSELERSIEKTPPLPSPRSLLSVTTWDGRELFDLRSVIK